MGTYIGNGLYKDNNNKLWKLALRLNKNDSQFYYDNPLWTNNTLLNENIFDLSNVSNSKYDVFNTVKTTKILIQMNNKDVISTLNDTYKNKTLYELFTTINPQNNYYTSAPYETIENYIGQTTSPWNFPRNGSEKYTESNICMNILNYQTNHGTTLKMRLGLAINEYTSFTSGGNTCGSAEGIGLYSNSNETYQYNNSGYIYWGNSNTFVPCNIFVEYNGKFLVKDGDKYKITDGNTLSAINFIEPYNDFIKYGMDNINQINSQVIYLIENNKFNINLLK